MNSAIDTNKRKISELGKTIDDSQKTINQLSKELKAAQHLLRNASKAADPAEFARLQIRVSDLRKALKEANAEIKNQSNAWKSVAKLKNIIIGVFTGIGYAITNELLGAFKSAFSIITDLESANAKLASVLGVTKDQIAELEKGAGMTESH